MFFIVIQKYYDVIVIVVVGNVTHFPEFHLANLNEN